MTAGIFTVLSLAAITAGGLLMAFSARKPTWLTSWMSAYLVLVVGVIQLGLVAGWRGLGEPDAVLALTAFILYNLGNLSVILGTAFKTRTKHYFAVVSIGGALLAASMILLLISVRHARGSWGLAGFIALVVVILISMPTGVVLSARGSKISVPPAQ